MSTTAYSTHNPPPMEPKEKRKRRWIVCRIVDYRFQALAPSDPEFPDDEMEWTDLGRDTRVDEDRETMFQHARSNGGLLLSVDGLPSVGRLTKFVEQMGATAAPVAPAPEPETTPAPPKSKPKGKQAEEPAADGDVPF